MNSLTFHSTHALTRAARPHQSNRFVVFVLSVSNVLHSAIVEHCSGKYSAAGATVRPFTRTTSHPNPITNVRLLFNDAICASMITSGRSCILTQRRRRERHINIRTDHRVPGKPLTASMSGETHRQTRAAVARLHARLQSFSSVGFHGNSVRSMVSSLSASSSWCVGARVLIEYSTAVAAGICQAALTLVFRLGSALVCLVSTNIYSRVFGGPRGKSSSSRIEWPLFIF